MSTQILVHLRSRDRRAGSGRQLPQARPAPHGAQPGHVRDRARRRVRDDPLPQGPRRRHREGQRLRRQHRRLAVVHRPLRELRRGDGRGPRQGPGRRRCARRAPRRPPAGGWPTGRSRRCRARSSPSATSVVVTAGEIIPADGDVVEGIASVDESAITGESAPVIRESGGDRSAVTGGTRVLSDEIVVRVTTRAGESFLDRMIALVEGASRQKTPNEIALDILLAGLDDHPAPRDRDAAALRRLLRRGAVGDRPHRAPRLPHPDDDRRAALRDRHRRHGSARPAQRARA